MDTSRITDLAREPVPDPLPAEPHDTTRTLSAEKTPPPQDAPAVVSSTLPPPPPRKMGPYTVLESLGEGGMGRVLLAEDPAGRKVALKLLAPWADETGARRFEREARLLRDLSHPNVVGVVDHGVDEATGEPYLALELVSGRDLQVTLAARGDDPMLVEEAVFLLERIARALTVVHELGVVHRDVKPANVLITAEGEVKLTDFGIALARDASTRLTGPDEILGTAHYLSPEAIQGGVEVGPPADLYALGALAWRLLAGAELFAGRPIPEVLKAHLREVPPSLRTLDGRLPPSLVRLVDGLLAKDPADRPTALDVVARLRPFLPHTTLIARLWTAEDEAARKKSISDRLRSDRPVTLNQYRIERELGRGGMGIVYQAYHVGLKKKVALKTLLAGALATDDERRRFLKEAEAAASLVHPNIVRVLDAGQSEGTYFLAMEHVEGAPLSRVLRDRPGGLDPLLRLFVGVCEGVHHAHVSGVIHRDLKPDNVLVDPAGTPRILDFGMAKRVGDDRATATLTADGDILGTVRYMPPEQAAGHVSLIDARSDVWALGAILYEILTGTTPYTGSAQDVLVKIHLEDPPQPSARRPGIPWELDAIALKALERERDHRYQSARALADDVTRYLEQRPISARKASVPYRAQKWILRNRAQAMLTISSVVVALVMAAAFWVQQGVAVERGRRERVTQAALVGLRQLAARDPVSAGASFGRAREGLTPDEALPLPEEARPLLPRGEPFAPLDAKRLERWTALAEQRRAVEAASALLTEARAALRGERLDAAMEAVLKAALLAPDEPEVQAARRGVQRRCERDARLALGRALDLPVVSFDDRGRHLLHARASLDLAARAGDAQELARTRALLDEERALLERDQALARLAEEAAARRREAERHIDVRAATAEPIPADGERACAVEVVVRDAAGQPRADHLVRFDVEGGGRALEPEVTTDARGVATTHVVSTIAGPTTVGAIVVIGEDEVPLGGRARVLFEAGPVDPAASTLAALGAPAVADGAAVVTLTVALRDRHGNPVAGRRVEVAVEGRDTLVSQPVDPSGPDGLVVAALRSTVAEVKSITATVAGVASDQVTLSQVALVRFVPGAPDPLRSIVAASPAGGVVADAAAVTTISVRVVDANGNPVPGQTVKVGVSGAGNDLEQPAGVTGEDGVVLATLSSGVVETKTITAVLNPGSHELTLGRAASVEFVVGPLDLLTSTVKVQPGDGIAAVVVTARDALGNPIAGLRVELSAPAATITQPSTVTDAQGEVRGAVAWKEGGSLPRVGATVFTREGPRKLEATGE